MKIPKRIAQTLMNSLKGGVVPRVGLPYITVGRKDEIDALLHDVDLLPTAAPPSASSWANTAAAKAFCCRPSAAT